MKTNRKYAIAVALLGILAVVFGLVGTVTPMTETESAQESSSSDSFTQFASTEATYDSGWVNATDEQGQYFSLTHGLNTTEVIVDIAGKRSPEPEDGTLDWSRTYGGMNSEYAYSVLQTLDSGYAIAGYTGSSGAGLYDFWLVRTDWAGNVLWNQTYGGASHDYARSVVQTVDGGYAIAGYTISYGAGSYDFWLVKTDSAGNQQWNQTYGGTGSDRAFSVVQTNDGGYALVGDTTSYGAGDYDFWLVRTDSDGNHLWNKTYGGTGSDCAYSVVHTSDEGYAIAGYTQPFGASSSDSWLVKTDAVGDVLWSTTYGGADWDVAHSLVETGDGGYALAGYTASYGAGSYDFWLVKTDTAGNHEWNKTYGGPSTDVAYSVIQTFDGDYAISGYTQSYGAGSYDFWLVKTDSAGNQQWNQTYGGINGDRAYSSMVQTDDGGYAISGYTQSYGAGNADFWLVKVNPVIHRIPVIHRASGWRKTYGFGDTPADFARSVVQTSDGGYALAGYAGSKFWLVRTDAVGNQLWSKTYGPKWPQTGLAYALSMVQTVDGGYALAGYTQPYVASNADFWLVKTDLVGNHVWNRTFGGVGNEIAHSLVQTSDGGYALAGYTNSSGAGSYDFWLVKTNSDGIQQWNRTFGGSGTERAISMVQTSDGGYALAGYTDSVVAGSYDFWLVRTNSTGNMEWNQTYGGAGNDFATSMVQTSDGGYALAGSTCPYGLVFTDCWLVKTDSAGNALWNKTYGGTHSDEADSVIQTSDGGYALAGTTFSYSVHDHVFLLVKTNSAGKALWSKTYGGTDGDHAYSVIQTSDGGYALAGDCYSSVTGSTYFQLVKIDVESGLSWTSLTPDNIFLYRGETDLDWVYVRVRLWLMKEPNWQFGDINMDGVVDAKDLYILGRNYGKTFSLLSLTGIIAVAGVHTVKKRKQNKQPTSIS